MSPHPLAPPCEPSDSSVARLCLSAACLQIAVANPRLDAQALLSFFVQIIFIEKIGSPEPPSPRTVTHSLRAVACTRYLFSILRSVLPGVPLRKAAHTDVCVCTIRGTCVALYCTCVAASTAGCLSSASSPPAPARRSCQETLII